MNFWVITARFKPFSEANNFANGLAKIRSFDFEIDDDSSDGFVELWVDAGDRGKGAGGGAALLGGEGWGGDVAGAWGLDGEGKSSL